MKYENLTGVVVFFFSLSSPAMTFKVPIRLGDSPREPVSLSRSVDHFARGEHPCLGQPPLASFDFTNFQYKKGGGTEWAPFDVWYWLMSPRNVVQIISPVDSSGNASGTLPTDATQVVVDFNPLLLENGNAVVLFKESVWKMKSVSTMELVKVNQTAKVSSTWSVSEGALKIGDFGSGKAVECQGQPALDFTFSQDLGTVPLAGRRVLVFYGSSTFDPLR